MIKINESWITGHEMSARKHWSIFFYPFEKFYLPYILSNNLNIVDENRK